MWDDDTLKEDTNSSIRSRRKGVKKSMHSIQLLVSSRPTEMHMIIISNNIKKVNKTQDEIAVH